MTSGDETTGHGEVGQIMKYDFARDERNIYNINRRHSASHATMFLLQT